MRTLSVSEENFIRNHWAAYAPRVRMAVLGQFSALSFDEFERRYRERVTRLFLAGVTNMQIRVARPKLDDPLQEDVDFERGFARALRNIERKWGKPRRAAAKRGRL